MSLETVFVNVRYTAAFMQFRVTIVTNCVALTDCMKVSYVVNHELESSLLFQCISSNVSADNIFFYI
jgi:hypothetical protein